MIYTQEKSKGKAKVHKPRSSTSAGKRESFYVWNDRSLHFDKKLWGKTSFLMPKFNLELFKTLILNFAYIHSKRRKLGMFILFQKCQFIYRNKVIPPPIRQFSSFSIFGHVTIINR